MDNRQQRPGPYELFVEAQKHSNPCLENLAQFLNKQRAQVTEKPPRTACLNNDQQSGWSRQGDLSSIDLRRRLEQWAVFDFAEIPGPHISFFDSPKNKQIVKTLLVKDLNTSVVETLGSFFRIDPLFFASHIHSPRLDLDTYTPDLAILSSRARPQTYFNVHYHRTLVFNEGSTIPRKLFRASSNLNRKVVNVRLSRNRSVGFSQHSVSGLVAGCGRLKIGIILVDPPVGNTYFVDKACRVPIQLSTRLYLGGYEDWLDPPTTVKKEDPYPKCGLFDDLLNYWTRMPPEAPTLDKIELWTLAHIPLRVVAGEWNIYAAVMHKSIKHYEYSGDGQPGTLEEIDRLHADMRELQSWRRRGMASQQKLQTVLRCLRCWKESVKDAEIGTLVTDYTYLSSIVDDCGRRLENMLPVVASLVQVVDSRRSFAETANITRLTVLALVFVPLTFVSSLFSMQPDKALGGQNFWVYFAVALPITMLVYCVARPPFRDVQFSFGRTHKWKLFRPGTWEKIRARTSPRDNERGEWYRRDEQNVDNVSVAKSEAPTFPPSARCRLE